MTENGAIPSMHLSRLLVFVISLILSPGVLYIDYVHKTYFGEFSLFLSNVTLEVNSG